MFTPSATAFASGPYLPDSRTLRALLQPLLAALGSKAKVERLGSSRAGRPIDLISVGKGARSVLVVGVPHANEPIGCLTIVRLLRRLASDPAFLDRSDAVWHFIPAIDVDGLDMNAGWLSRPPTLARYMQHFYRPAFANQPEYAFPIDVAGYRFDASTPENLCWQRALEIARPTLQSSLHGADSGGAFYLLSRDHADLGKQLSRQPQTVGIALNETGEEDPAIRRFAPGVFSFFEVGPYLQTVAHAARSDLWSAGLSSSEFAARRFGSFSMTCEVPIWADAREGSTAPSTFTQAGVLQTNRRQAIENRQLLNNAGRLLNAQSTPAQIALASALREAAAELPGQLAAIEASLGVADDQERLQQRDVARLELDLVLLRTPAMLRRLAELCDDTRINRESRLCLARRIAAFQARTTLRPTVLEAATTLQMQSIITVLSATIGQE